MFARTIRAFGRAQARAVPNVARRRVALVAVAAASVAAVATTAWADDKKGHVVVEKPAEKPAESREASTHFTLDELEKKKSWFKEKYPSGISLEEFARLLNITDESYASMIFHAIDTDHNGVIDLNEWLMYASMIAKGTPEERLRFQFNVFDLNGDGSISFSELVEIIRMQLKSGYIPLAALEHHEHLWQVGKRTPEDLALQLLKDADANHDDKISFSEFGRLCADIEALRKAHLTSIAEKRKMVEKLVVK